ncbi:MAG: ATP synthase F1 subunit epsilon [Coriobacteriales bacterium]|jgi:F-type H+-transporting ATPase subunit epsilon|nr:ATP synthase F1 subunit epsilon [Coriobacteriales bacterium]
MASFLCDIVTPASLLFSEEVSFVSVPATEGEIGILAKRSPIMSTLRGGEIRIKREEGDAALRFAVAGGYVESDGNKVVVLASRAVGVDTLDAEEVRVAKEASEKELAAFAADDSRAAFYRDELSWYTLLQALLAKAH